MATIPFNIMTDLCKRKKSIIFRISALKVFSISNYHKEYWNIVKIVYIYAHVCIYIGYIRTDTENHTHTRTHKHTHSYQPSRVTAAPGRRVTNQIPQHTWRFRIPKNYVPLFVCFDVGLMKAFHCLIFPST